MDKKQLNNYIYATNRPWAIDAFISRRSQLTGNWAIVTSPEDLVATVSSLSPRYVFFPHWSHIVPKDIVNSVECVCFHMTDLPYGRGGSPLQNLIVRKKKQTKLSALRMTETLDGGPIYSKTDLSLEGSAEQIFKRMSKIAINMLEEIITIEPCPIPQEEASVEVFRRRSPSQSVIPEKGTLDSLHDHIRMLDAPGYPHAYLEFGEYKIELRDTKKIVDNTLKARARITKLGNKRKPDEYS